MKKKIGTRKVWKALKRVSETAKMEMIMNMKLELYILDNGEVKSNMGLEYKFGLTVLNIRDSGSIIRHMAKEHSGMLKAAG